MYRIKICCGCKGYYHSYGHQTPKVVECPHKKVVTPSSFSSNIKAHVQYGESITVLSGLLSSYGAVSLKRIHVLLGSSLGEKILPATIYSTVNKCAKIGRTCNGESKNSNYSSICRTF